MVQSTFPHSVSCHFPMAQLLNSQVNGAPYCTVISDHNQRPGFGAPISRVPCDFGGVINFSWTVMLLSENHYQEKDDKKIYLFCWLSGNDHEDKIRPYIFLYVT